MDPRTYHELAARWRADAAVLRRRGAAAQAALLEGCAEELARVEAATEEELLSLAEASRLSGYSADHLGKLVKRRQLANHGRAHAPRVRRGDLPRKAAGAAVVPLTPLSGSFETIRREAIATVQPTKAG